jgi:REP element-mobilizing transposase RayT
MSPKQLNLKLPQHGGKRRGAGRKPKGPRALVSHAQRPKFDKPLPAHVTLKVRRDIPSLRASRRFLVIRRSFAASRRLHGMRLIHFNVLGDHLHLIVEAESSEALSRGMQGLNVRLAHALNVLLERRGTVFADHYHAHLLRTPTEVARAIRYVLANAERHYGDRGPDDFCSTAPGMEAIVVPATTWLLRVGWRRIGGTAIDV